MLALWSYGAGPGEIGAPPASWPTASRLARHDRYLLEMFVHPLCPCSRASLAELERLVAAAGDHPLDVHVVFIAPDGTDSSWHESALVKTARRIPGVNVHIDTNRGETKLFQVRTSGSSLLYDPAGTLVFDGGLTSARGHEGVSAGAQTILALLRGAPADVQSTSVYGCPLFESANPGRSHPSTAK